MPKMDEMLPMEDEESDMGGREAEAEELGRLIEAKDWVGLLDLLKPDAAIAIGIGTEDEE